VQTELNSIEKQTLTSESEIWFRQYTMICIACSHFKPRLGHELRGRMFIVFTVSSRLNLGMANHFRSLPIYLRVLSKSLCPIIQQFEFRPLYS
jgi:hypothetical protein